jgi:mRNA interferase RelE/StbE
MHKVDKFLARIDKKSREKILHAITCIKNNKTSSLDIKKLHGFDSLYRVRIGGYRIVFEINKSVFIILSISKRGETTYNL